MADNKGIFTAEQEKVLAVMVDDAVKLKGFAELIDGYVARIAVTVIDDQLIDKLKAEIKVKLADLATAVLAKEWDTAEELAAEVLDDLINIPGIDDDAESLLFKGFVEVLVAAIQMWIEKKRTE